MQLVIGLAILKVKGRRASAKGVAERNQYVPYNLTITLKDSAGQSIEQRNALSPKLSEYILSLTLPKTGRGRSSRQYSTY